MGQNLFKSKRNDEDNNNRAQLTDDENLFFEFIVSPEYLDWRRNDKTITEEEILKISKRIVMSGENLRDFVGSSRHMDHLHSYRKNPALRTKPRSVGH